MARSTRLDERALRAILSEQDCVVSRSQATECGLTPDALAHRLRPGGRWPDGVLTGLVALHHNGVARSAPAVIDVLVPLSRRRGSSGFAVLHRTSRMPDEVIVDSREWHLSPADWERTLRRHARMSEHGIIVLHFTPRQIRSGSAAVLTAIAGALAAGADRPPLRVTAPRPRPVSFPTPMT